MALSLRLVPLLLAAVLSVSVCGALSGSGSVSSSSVAGPQPEEDLDYFERRRLQGDMSLVGKIFPPHDEELMLETIYLEPSGYDDVKVVVLEYPDPYGPPPQGPAKNITSILVEDLLRNGLNGFRKVIRGGIGEQQVAIQFKSQRGRPMKYEVSIYGRELK